MPILPSLPHLNINRVKIIFVVRKQRKSNIYCAKKEGGGGSRDLIMVSVSMDSCLKFFLTKRA